MILCVHTCHNNGIKPITDKFDASSSKNFVKFKMVRQDNIFYYHFLKFQSMNFLGFSSFTTIDDGGILITEVVVDVLFIKTTLVIITISQVEDKMTILKQQINVYKKKTSNKNIN